MSSNDDNDAQKLKSTNGEKRSQTKMHPLNENGDIQMDMVELSDGDEEEEQQSDADGDSDSDDTTDDGNEDDGETEEEDAADDDDDDESEESDGEDSTNGCINSVDAIVKAPLSPNSVPTCYICLNEFDGQDIGSPDSCENLHHFCLECIEEWSKQINTCPVDRKSFSFILVKRDIDGEIIMKVPVAKTSVIEIEAMDDDLTYCEICGRCDREDRLLLCDGCDFGYHCECLSPPLETIPIDEWFCPECFDRLFGDDVRQETYRRQSSSRRAIARTGAFEIVRNRILARRTTQQPTRSGGVAATSSTRRTTTTTKRKTRRKTTKRKKTRKTKKSTKSASSSKGKKTTKRRRKTKKRTRKSKLSNQRLPSATVRSRIASKLGISCKPKSPYGLPKMSSKSFSIADIRSSAGIGNLSMFGYELELNNPRSYGDEDDDFEFAETSFGGGVGLLARARSHISSNPIRKSIKSPEPIMSTTDLLSEIMNSQEILHTASRDLNIARDGRIYLKSNAKNIQKCPDSQSSSSSSSSQSISNENNGNTSNANNSNSNGYLKQSSYSESASSCSKLTESDLNLPVKPSPVVALLDEKPDFELYSDIESVGDNKEENDDSNKTDKKSPIKSADSGRPHCDKPESDLSDDLLNHALNDHNNNNGQLDGKTDSVSVDKTTKSTEGDSKTKRRPSIKDLFGGDSDEEVDDELQQLVAQQGSINVHYPIKMPIVLKTNLLNENKDYSQNAVDEVPISKKWIPIYPEVEKSTKNTGPKWKAIGGGSGTTNVDKSDWKANNSSHAPGSSIGGGVFEKTKGSGGSSVDEILKVQTKELNNVIIERRIGLSRSVAITAASKDELNKQSSTVPATTSTTAAAAAVAATSTISIMAHVSSDLNDKKLINSNESADKKVRVCKHGRVKKEKQTAKDETSNNIEQEQNKRVQPFDFYEDKSGERQTKRPRIDETGVDDVDDDSNVNWKKMPSSTKTRNYRDGKYKESDLLHKERPLKSESYTEHKKSSYRDGDSRREIKFDHDRDSHYRRRDDDERRHRRSQEKLSSSRSRHKSNSKTESDSRSRRRSKENRRSSSRRKSPVIEEVLDGKDLKSGKNHRHRNHHHHHNRRHSNEEESSQHRHHHRHHHSSKQQQRHQSSHEKKDTTIASSSGVRNEAASKKSSNYQTYPVIKSVDSKEIYSEGDKIIINVNFKREEPSNSDKSRVSPKNDLESNNKNESDSTDQKDSGNCSNPDNVDILSPQSTDGYSNAHLQSDNSITSPLPGEGFGGNTNQRSNLKNLSNSDNLKKVLSEEFNFLPRILQMKESNNSADLGPRTPSDHYDMDDSFMPTPTQDESNSPINAVSSNSIIGRLNKPSKPSASSIRSTSPTEPKDDFYDPEVPLQSPDRESIKSPSKDKMVFDSVASPKDSPNAKRDNLALSQANLLSGSSSSSLSSTVAAAAKTLASLNSINLAQLLKIAQTIKTQNVQNNNAGNGDQPHSSEPNRDIVEAVDMDVDSPSPINSPNTQSSSSNANNHASNVREMWDQFMKTGFAKLNAGGGGGSGQSSEDSKKPTVKFNIDEQPTSAVDMAIKDKYMKKLNRLERVVEEVKLSLKPYYQKKKITKEEYKEILRKAVPKICHSKTGEINPAKIQKLVEGYVKRYRYMRSKSANN